MALRQRSFRRSPSTLDALDRRARLRGEPGSRLAERLVDEGLRMDVVPGVVFRDGPTGRRAALVGGPDVWEVIRLVREVGSAGPDARREAANAVALTAAQVETAVAYYGEYPDEIDRRIALDEEEAERAEAAWRRRQALVG